MPEGRRLLFFVTEDWYFCSHRLPLAIAAREAGYEVSVVTRVANHSEMIRDAGISLIPFDLSRRGINPFKELGHVIRLVRTYKSLRPDIVHHVALKPVVYGSIAARIANVPLVVNALAGLGLLFSSNSVRTRIIRWVMKSVFRVVLNFQNSQLILQNPDDVNALCDARLLPRKRVSLIRGSGVDCSVYRKLPEPGGTPVVVLASRMLWDKGVGEFVEAAQMLRKAGVDARFILAGDQDDGNPRSIPRAQLEEWDTQGDIEWRGRCNDIPGLFANANIVCLPTYYGEGVPKVLIEAASCGRAIVATESPGCREIVREGVNGLLVAQRDTNTLAAAIDSLLADPAKRQMMGDAGRDLVKNEFALNIVIDQTMAIYKDIG